MRCLRNIRTHIKRQIHIWPSPECLSCYIFFLPSGNFIFLKTFSCLFFLFFLFIFFLVMLFFHFTVCLCNWATKFCRKTQENHHHHHHHDSNKISVLQDNSIYIIYKKEGKFWCFASLRIFFFSSFYLNINNINNKTILFYLQFFFTCFVSFYSFSVLICPCLGLCIYFISFCLLQVVIIKTR